MNKLTDGIVLLILFLSSIGLVSAWDVSLITPSNNSYSSTGNITFSFNTSTDAPLEINFTRRPFDILVKRLSCCK